MKIPALTPSPETLAESFPKNMVKRKALEKLSNIELEKYIKPESRFVSDAIEIAYEILKSRGRTFTEIENEQIQNLIQTKKDGEPKYDEINNNGWDKNYTEDENAIERICPSNPIFPSLT